MAIGTGANGAAPGELDFAAVFVAHPGAGILMRADAPRFTIVAASDAYLRATLLAREALLGRALFEVFPDANPENPEPTGEVNVRASLDAVLRTRAPHRMPVQRYDIRRPDGGWDVRYWAPQNIPVLGPDGAPRYVLHHVEDVTDRFRAEAALRASEERLRLAVAATGLGIFDWDLTTDRVTVNARFRELLGLPEGDEIIGAAMLGGVVHPDDRAAVEARLGAAFDPRSAGSYQFEHRAITLKSEERWLLTFGQVFFAGEGAERRPVRVIGNDLDITERKRHEAERERLLAASEEARDALESANAQLQEQALELELANQQLQDNAAELEVQAEELQATAAQLEERTEAAEEARRRIEAVLGSIGDAFYLLDRGWRFTHVNDAAEPLLQSPRERLLGRTLWDAFPEVAGSPFEGPYREAMATGRPTSAEAYFPPLGTWFDVHSYPWPGGLMVHFRDVTARKTAEAERERLLADLQGANAELRRVTAAAQAEERRARFLADLGHALQPVTEPDAVMETAARLLGEHLGADRCAYAEVEADEDTFTITGNYTRGDTIDILGRFTFRAFGAEVLRLMRANEAYVVDDAGADPRVTPPDRAAYAQTQIAAVVCVPLHKAGRFAAAMAVHQRVPRRWTPDEVDLVVTVVQRCWESLERARALRRLRESEATLRATSSRLAERTAAAEAARHEAERANQVKTDFLATMSHELRTPLNAIAGYAELLDIGVHGPVTEPQREAISRIQRSQRHLLGLINDVLNFAKLEAGRVEYHVADVPVPDAIDAIEPLVAPQLRAKALRYDRSQCSLQQCVVRADAEKLQQILLNLLSNAIKFTAAGGAVTVRCEERGDVVTVAVADTGIGIAADRLEHVFAPFVQLDRRLNAPHEGTGLGLAISRDLARGMGGDLTGESTPGAGSTFTLTLPRPGTVGP